MTNQNDISSPPSLTGIAEAEKNVRFYNYVSVGLLAFTLVSALLLNFHRTRLEAIRKLQLAQLESSQEKAKVKIATLTKDTETTKKDTAVAKQKAAESQERAAIAELHSKELEIQLEKLKLATADRFIPKHVADALIPELKKHKNKKVIISCGVSNSHETVNFSQQLSALFRSANWDVIFVNRQNIIIPPPQGIIITAFGEANRQIAKAFFNQFTQLGYIILEKFQPNGATDIEINILAK